MRHLYLQIYAAFVVVGLLCLVAAGLTAAAIWDRSRTPFETVTNAVFLAATLPPASDPSFDRRFEEAAEALDDHALSVWSAEGALLGRSGAPLPHGEPGWVRTTEARGFRVRLPDGRLVAVADAHEPRRREGLLVMLGTVGLVVAFGCYPIARRITRRLEDVQEGMERWGAGELDARVAVRGRDEVAAVAQTFNDAAAQVQRLVVAQRRTLASASHELRSPLARLRMALELLDDEDPERRRLLADAVRDVEELDATVGDLLQVGRMQALERPEHPEPVDLRALLDDEGRHVDADVSGPPTVVQGEERLLRRLIRNLLENARQHGGGAVEAWTTDDGLVVADRGPGVADEEVERIFEPFHRPVGHDEGRHGGVGLGLHLVREIARYHGLEVRYRPREGGGSTFVLSRP